MPPWDSAGKAHHGREILIAPRSCTGGCAYNHGFCKPYWSLIRELVWFDRGSAASTNRPFLPEQNRSSTPGSHPKAVRDIIETFIAEELT
ncbi:MAG: hypothetical protein LBU45_08175 [Azoarcus sp.]|jgi:hypothetical protein|nr:hypothetical protein [Azoarcus sp.]